MLWFQSNYESSKFYPIFPRYNLLKDMIKDVTHHPDYMEHRHESRVQPEWAATRKSFKSMIYYYAQSFPGDIPTKRHEYHTHTTHTSCNVPKSQFYVNIRIMMDVLLLKRQEINCQFSCWYVHFDNLLQSTTGNHCLLSIFILPWLSPQKREKLILIDFYLCLFLSDNKQSLMRTAIQNCWLSQSHLKNVITL